jgi:hypothetical protein
LRSTLQIQKQKADFRKELAKQHQELAVARKAQAEARLKEQQAAASIDLTTFLKGEDTAGTNYTGTVCWRSCPVSVLFVK